MSEEVAADRRPGMTVTVCGLAFSALTLYAVHWLNEYDINPMGFYLNAVIPAGALLVGVCSGLGFAVSSRVLQVPLGRGHVVGMVLTGLITYWMAQYETYAYVIDKAGIPPAQYSFTDYVRDSCEQMAFKPNNARDQAKPLGIWGYLFKFLEMAGYVAGSVVPALVVSNMPYCRGCQKYYRSHRTGYLHSPETWAEIKKLGKKERGDAIEQVVVAMGPQIQTALELLSNANFAMTDAFVGDLKPKEDKNAAAYVSFAIQKCPDCEAHRVTVTLGNYAIDKTPKTTKLAMLEKSASPLATETPNTSA